MDKVLTFKTGSRAIADQHAPHAGLKLTPAVKAGLIPEAQSLPDTDWHVPQLYDFAADLGASTAAEYSRFVIDLNRPGRRCADVRGGNHRSVPGHTVRRSTLVSRGAGAVGGRTGDLSGAHLEALPPDLAAGAQAPQG